ncbi:Sensor protein SrrB [Anatilimnocola aggregata]|uniref:histidine kinase n=1 Tax=Anatilimnocola aggregata TaxID=2528021 RepID=A0A517YLT6_9BACT|nr:HAMP domain-containing sensor histidine kinase [Anatilimnocola aggregata]QDU31183.1 Sensor protein SrrB [Anatilimnocola aggregata]
MFERRSLRLPITLGVVLIVLVVLMLVGTILTLVIALLSSPTGAGWYWAWLSIGTTLLILILLGVIMYLVLSIKAVNLTRRQSNFIDSVTHELKSPIASLKLYIQTLNRRQISPTEQESFFKDMLEDVERLDQLINHLLDVARMDRVAKPGEEADVAIDDVLRSCTQQVCLRHQVPLETVRLDLAPAIIHCRRVDLELVFRNLIDNAVKYAADENPSVEVKMDFSESGRVIVRVCDNGRGIPPELRRKIFGRFVRLGSELERDKPGTGLGLHIVRTLLGRLRGQIQVRDRPQGRGTMFEVNLPGTQRAALAETEDKPSPSNPIPTNTES